MGIPPARGLDHLGIARAAVVAQSMGGWAAVGAAASPPRPSVLWHAALGETFRKERPVRAFLYAQISGINTPLPADFRDQLGRLTTPVERYAAACVPTLFLTSDEDGLIWPDLSEKVHRHVPGSHFVRVEAAGRSTYFEPLGRMRIVDMNALRRRSPHPWPPVPVT